MKVYPPALTDLITSYAQAMQASLVAKGYAAPRLPAVIRVGWRKATKIVNGKLSFKASGVWASACHTWRRKSATSVVEYAMQQKPPRVNSSVFTDARHEVGHGVMCANNIGRSYQEQHSIMKTLQGSWY